MSVNKDIRKAIEELEQVSGDEKLQRIAELREKAIRDDKAALAYALDNGLKKGLEKGYREGLEKGLKEGIEKGIEEGLEEGLEKGLEKGIEKGIEKGLKEGILQNKIETAKKMLEENISLEIISKVTGLEKEEIEKIK